MNFTFPPTKFVEENTYHQQVKHVISEMRETIEAFENMESYERVEEEIIDTLHSIETYIRIRDKRYPGDIERTIDKVKAKNERRAYYLE